MYHYLDISLFPKSSLEVAPYRVMEWSVGNVIKYRADCDLWMYQVAMGDVNGCDLLLVSICT